MNTNPYQSSQINSNKLPRKTVIVLAILFGFVLDFGIYHYLQKQFYEDKYSEVQQKYDEILLEHNKLCFKLNFEKEINEASKEFHKVP